MWELTQATGFAHITWREIAMLAFALTLLYLATARQVAPLLLVPMAFASLLVNLPLNGLVSAPHGGQVGGLFHYLGQGLRLEIFPLLMFLGLGALSDFGPVLGNPKTLLLAGAAQLGVFGACACAYWLGFTPAEAASIGIIGGGDGPTSIFLADKLAPHLLGPIALSAYSYMALAPLIQPPIMRLLTTKRERAIRMSSDFDVPRWLRIVFPVAVTVSCALLVPAATPLVGLLMFGNLLRECGVTAQLGETVQSDLMNLVTIVLGLSIGAAMSADSFLRPASLKILALGWFAFSLSTVSGLLLAKLLSWLPGAPINPLIGAAGVSAAPLAARVAQQLGHEEDPHNDLLMHALGPNVAGAIASALAAGALLTWLR